MNLSVAADANIKGMKLPEVKSPLILRQRQEMNLTLRDLTEPRLIRGHSPNCCCFSTKPYLLDSLNISLLTLISVGANLCYTAFL